MAKKVKWVILVFDDNTKKGYNRNAFLKVFREKVGVWFETKKKRSSGRR